jgi:hypothetical protein
MKTQTQNIIEHLKQGNSITPIEALNQFGCFRLGARIFEIKQLGYDIDTKKISVGDHKHVAEYSLTNPFTEL